MVIEPNKDWANMINIHMQYFQSYKNISYLQFVYNFFKRIKEKEKKREREQDTES